MAINDGDTAWVLTSTALVFIMVPGLGYFYSGLASHKNALSLLFLSGLSVAVVSVQWWLWGFSLAFAPEGGPFIGNLSYSFMNNLFEDGAYTYPGVPLIPGTVFMVFQQMFAAITPAIALGSAAERIRVIPCIVFLFVWSTLVYDFIAYWTWAPNGFLRVMGSYDFAGGTPVHIASGAAGVALALMTGKRKGFGTESYKPHNLSAVFLGTALLWFGWLGFNGGSALAGNARAAIAVVNTNLAACVSGLTWVLLDYRHNNKISAFSFCSGVIAGLVTITPGCGFVPVWSSVIFGIVGALASNAVVSYKHRYGFDDALDAFNIHGVGGLTGNLLTGIFASKTVIFLDGVEAAGGWLDGHWMQFLYQLAGSVVGFVWSFGVTYAILWAMNRVPWLRLGISEDMATDEHQLGERLYDYIEAAVQQGGRSADSLNRMATTTTTKDGKVTPMEMKPLSPGGANAV